MQDRICQPWLGTLPRQFFQQNYGRFFVQRLIIIAAFGRLDTARAAVLAGAFGDGPVGRFPQLSDQFIALLGDADAAGMGVIDKYLGFAGIRMEGRRNAADIVAVAQGE